MFQDYKIITPNAKIKIWFRNSLHIMKAVILAAGEGTRLKPFTESMPKVMLPVANKPILSYTIEALKRNGIMDIVIVVGYKKESIMDYFGNGKEFGVRIEYVMQEKQIGTGHALLQAENYLDEDFILLPGDNIIDGGSILSLLKEDCEICMLVEKSTYPSKYGVVEVKEGMIKSMVEKPEIAETNIISTGIFKLPLSVFDFLKNNVKQGNNSITDSIQSMIDAGKNICAVSCKGKWMDIVYPWNWLEVNSKSLKNLSSVSGGKIEKNVVIKGDVIVGRDSIIHSGCYIAGPVVIGRGCEIGPNACIFSSTSIGDNVAIYPFTEIRHSIIMDGATIGSHSFVSKSIVGKGTKISSRFSNIVGSAVIDIDGKFHRARDIGTFIGEGCEIGDGVVITPGKIVGSNCQIEPLNLINRNIPDRSKVI